MSFFLEMANFLCDFEFEFEFAETTRCNLTVEVSATTGYTDKFYTMMASTATGQAPTLDHTMHSGLNCSTVSFRRPLPPFTNMG